MGFCFCTKFFYETFSKSVPDVRNYPINMSSFNLGMEKECQNVTPVLTPF